MESLEPGHREEGFDEDALDDGEHTHQNTDGVLLPSQGAGPDWLSTELYKQDLDTDGTDDDGDEEEVVEETGEDVVLLDAELAGVYLVEDLHEHEGVEDQGVMFDLLGVF